MNRAELESTAPMNRDELLGLLSTMTPTDEQPITARARISDIEAELARQLALELTKPQAARTEPPEDRKARKAARAAKKAARKAAKKAALANAAALERDAVPTPVEPANDGPARLFNDVDWDQLLGAAVSAMVTPKPPTALPPPIPAAASEPQPKRKYARPCSHVAALLEPCEPGRFPRATRPPPMRATTNNGTERPIAEQKAARAVAEVRARLDSAEESAAERAASHERVAFPALSAQVVAQLSGEEIAMLPMELRLSLPDATDWQPARIEMTPVPGLQLRSARCEPVADSIVTAPVHGASPLRVMTIITSFAAAFFLGACAYYFLL
jgi:hypothetical protein